MYDDCLKFEGLHMILKVCACLSVHLPDFECMYCKGSIAHRPVCVQTGCMSKYGIACAKQKRGGGACKTQCLCVHLCHRRCVCQGPTLGTSPVPGPNICSETRLPTACRLRFNAPAAWVAKKRHPCTPGPPQESSDAPPGGSLD